MSGSQGMAGLVHLCRVAVDFIWRVTLGCSEMGGSLIKTDTI